MGGYPTLGTPPLDLARGNPGGGGYSTSYRITDGVLDTSRSVCLLRSRRRTFLFFVKLKLSYSSSVLNSLKAQLGFFLKIWTCIPYNLDSTMQQRYFSVQGNCADILRNSGRISSLLHP